MDDINAEMLAFSMEQRTSTVFVPKDLVAEHKINDDSGFQGSGSRNRKVQSMILFYYVFVINLLNIRCIIRFDFLLNNIVIFVLFFSVCCIIILFFSHFSFRTYNQVFFYSDLLHSSVKMLCNSHLFHKDLIRKKRANLHLYSHS